MVKTGGGVVELHSEWGGDNIVSLGLGGGNKFFQSNFVSGGGHYFEKFFARFARSVLSFHGNLHLKSTMMHFVTLILLYIAL